MARDIIRELYYPANYHNYTTKLPMFRIDAHDEESLKNIVDTANAIIRNIYDDREDRVIVLPAEPVSSGQHTSSVVFHYAWERTGEKVGFGWYADGAVVSLDEYLSLRGGCLTAANKDMTVAYPIESALDEDSELSEILKKVGRTVSHEDTPNGVYTLSEVEEDMDPDTGHVTRITRSTELRSGDWVLVTHYGDDVNAIADMRTSTEAWLRHRYGKVGEDF